MKIRYPLIFFVSCLFLSSCLGRQPQGPRGALLPLDLIWIENLGTIKAQEPSGIIYHAEHDTFYVVSDEGEVVEMKLDGEIIQQVNLSQDLEGIALDPVHNILYIAVEGKEIIILLDGNTLEQVGSYQLEREFEGEPLLIEGGGGIEGITFVPDPNSRTQARLYLSDKSPDKQKSEKGALVFWVVIDRTIRPETQTVLEIDGYYEIAIQDISGLEYIESNQHLLLLSDKENLIVEITLMGEIVAQMDVLGRDQEGIALIGFVDLLIAQDSGEIQYYKMGEE